MTSTLFIHFYVVITLIAFIVSIWISKYWKSLIFNSFVLTVIFVITALLLFNIPYKVYMQGNALLNNLLGVAVVALALPLYEQLHQIRKRWKSILFITFMASLIAMVTGTTLSLLFGATPEIAATVLPKSISTPIAMEVAKNIGGIPSVAAVGVVLAGLQGSIFGYVLVKKLGVKHSEAIGLGVGSCSHALGTARCLELDTQAGIFSSIALVLCGIMTSMMAPIVLKIIMFFWQ